MARRWSTQTQRAAHAMLHHEAHEKIVHNAAHGRNTDFFGRFAQGMSRLSGRPITFMLAALSIVVWGVTGPIFKYSDTWQLVINTGTTVVTFLMVFLIQNTQNRDTLALQIKLSELIIALKEAETGLAGIEEESEQQLEELQAKIREKARQCED